MLKRDSNFIKPLISVNWHLWPYCNYHCKYCFATFNDIPEPFHLSYSEAAKVIELLGAEGFKKITFVGGEPTLCPFLDQLLERAKNLNLTNMIVTNGSKINCEFLDANAKNIDWVGFSVDSSNEGIQRLLGRGEGCYVKETTDKINLVREYGIKVKVNTVINSLNYQEEFHDFISKIEPDRWKALQILRIKGTNDDYYNSLSISSDQFNEFANKHLDLNPICESNDDMIGSYLMMDPLGRFFQNYSNEHIYSRSVLEVGVINAIKEVGWNYSKFIKRRGSYKW